MNCSNSIINKTIDYTIFYKLITEVNGIFNYPNNIIKQIKKICLMYL